MSIVMDVILDAYRELDVVGYDEEMDGAQAARGISLLYDMLREWQATDHLWFTDEQTVTLTTALSYTLAERAVRVHGVRLVRDGVETPMCEMTRQEYRDMPVKTSTGLPTAYYVDNLRGSTVLYIWCPLSAADGETLIVDFEREVTEPLLRAGTLDIPAEWKRAVKLNLACELARGFERPAPREDADIALARVMASDREGSVFFAGPYA
jgi:hypothetical protein